MKIYHVHGEGLRFHVCPTPDLADAVFQDLNKRFPDSKVQRTEATIDSSSVHVDFGGCVCGSWRPDEVMLRPDNATPITVSFWPHHVDLLIGKLKRQLQERERITPDGTRYIKLHVAYNTVCIGSAHAAVLLDSLRSRLPEISKRASEMLDDFEKAMEAMRTHNNILIPPPMNPKLVN